MKNYFGSIHGRRYRISSVIVVLLSILLMYSIQAFAITLFSDDFNSGASSAWGNERGSWRASDGVYDAAEPNNNPITYSGVTTLLSLTDFAVDVDINDLDDGGLWLRSDYNNGNINGVLLVTGGHGGSYDGLYWHTVQNGIFSSELMPVTSPGLQGSSIHLRVEVVNDTYSAFIGNSSTALTTLTTDLFSTGSVGLYDYSPTSGGDSPRGQTFDNFVVSDFSQPVPEPTTILLSGIGLLGVGTYIRRRKKK